MVVKFIQKGDAVDYVNPVADVAAGAVVVQGELVGVTRTDIKMGKVGSIGVYGIFEFPKAAGVGKAIAVGALTYWDAISQLATTDAGAGANKLIGKCVKGTADADTLVRVRLSQ